MFSSDFVLAPDKALVPAYRISPFRTGDIPENRALPVSSKADDYFRARFSGRRFVYCESARQGLGLALSDLGLKPADVVTILTTTGNHYVSGCVTREIDKICRWSRRIEPQTKCLLVNHEFGFPYEDLRALARHGLPIIEDAAHSFASNNKEKSVGEVGDYVLYSLPKFFPIQVGGLLVVREACTIAEPISADCKRYVHKVLSFYLNSSAKIYERRRENHRALASRFAAIGCRARFELAAHSVPGVFMFRTPPEVDLPTLKIFMQGHGIESSVFYGEQAFFVPVHDRLSDADLDYFAEVMRAFLAGDSAIGDFHPSNKSSS
jgi:hypothetical protein